jgi:uncharacterized coiled-coil DUF342 family protein
MSTLSSKTLTFSDVLGIVSDFESQLTEWADECDELIEELRDEIKEKDELVSDLRDEIRELEDEIRELKNQNNHYW